MYPPIGRIRAQALTETRNQPPDQQKSPIKELELGAFGSLPSSELVKTLVWTSPAIVFVEYAAVSRLSSFMVYDRISRVSMDRTIRDLLNYKVELPCESRLGWIGYNVVCLA